MLQPQKVVLNHFFSKVVETLRNPFVIRFEQALKEVVNQHRRSQSSCQIFLALCGHKRHYQFNLVNPRTLWMSGADFIIHVRSCPGQSFKNEHERIMSLLNIALNGCPFARQKGDPMSGQLLRGLGTMADIRAAAEKRPIIREAYLKSVQPPIDILTERFERLSLKGQKFRSLPYPTDDVS